MSVLKVGEWDSVADVETALGDLAILEEQFEGADAFSALDTAEGCLFSNVPFWQLYRGEMQA